MKTRRLIARLLFYPTLGWNMLHGRVLHRWRWWDRIDERLIIGAMPFEADVPSLHQEGVTAVINTCEEYAGPQRAYDQFGIEHLRLPTVDFTPPNLDLIEQGVAFIEEHMGKGGTVYVHCKAGRARCATVALCWLIRAKQMTPEEGQLLLLSKRSHVNKRLAQRRVVREFFERQQGGRIV